MPHFADGARWSYGGEEFVFVEVWIAGGMNPAGEIFLQPEQVLEAGPVDGDCGWSAVRLG